MALTGIEIFKLLPKTNCGDCGVPTCLAFGMKLAAGQAELSQCPHVSDEAKEKLDSASAPPVLPVIIGTGDDAFKAGGETVLFRHEKTFVNQTGIAVLVTDKMSDADVDKRIKNFNELVYDRVGLILKADLVAVKSESGDAGTFTALVNKVKDAIKGGLVIMSDNDDVLEAGVKACADKKPLIYAATKDNVDKIGSLAKEFKCPVAVKGEGTYDSVIELTEKLSGMGLKEIVIDTGSREMKKAFEEQLIMRRAAVKNTFRALGYSTIAFPCEMTDDPMLETLIASTFIAKYGGMVVLSDIEGHNLFPLLLERMNIFTDPQRPMATEQGIYPINNPDENSPVLITTNFSLTYFVVSGEIEGCKVPAWLLVMDCEGLSVLTAWAAGKFVADAIGPWVKKCGITDKIKHKNLIIPGYSATISGELEEELADWKIIIGPREAAHIPPFLKEQ